MVRARRASGAAALGGVCRAQRPHLVMLSLHLRFAAAAGGADRHVQRAHSLRRGIRSSSAAPGRGHWRCWRWHWWSQRSGWATTLPGVAAATVNFGVLASLFLVMALDLRRHARDDLHWRVPVVLSLPVLLGAVGFGSRSLRALLWPESVPNEMTVHSALNVGSALGLHRAGAADACHADDAGGVAAAARPAAAGAARCARPACSTGARCTRRSTSTRASGGAPTTASAC